uniref:Uncharacterized protein n=1 Tax=virus sp. ctML55 TaxID=2827627 RepID=A0A8S5RIU4_9VIRU|nr:MAG TPA: hypothetical protein [virus sp. ctML55]
MDSIMSFLKYFYSNSSISSELRFINCYSLTS